MDSGPLALALVAGAAAAFNPCGFALLPAYLAMLVAPPAGWPGARGAAPASGTAVALVRAARFSAGMTLGFVAVFGLFGVLIAPLSAGIEQYLPPFTVVIGVLLVLVGLATLSGRPIAVPGLTGLGRGPDRRWWSQVGYGVTFALASLSCTLAPFLAVTSGALRGQAVTSVVGSFVAYALGMGIVVTTLAAAVATTGAGATSRLRRAAPVVTRLSGALLVLAGGYVAWYGWFELRILSGGDANDPVVAAALSVQERLTRFVLELGPAGLVAVGAVLVAGVAVGAIHRRRS